MPDLLGVSMFGTLLEALCISIPAVWFTLIFRLTAVKFPFAEIHNIEQDIISNGKKCDFGVCGRCGKRIKIAKERFMSVFGKSERHSCENCGIFLRENPFHVMFYGLAEIGIVVVLFGGLVAHYDGNTSTPQNAFGLFLFFGAIDGLRRLFAGSAACVGLKLRTHEPGQNLEGKLQKIGSLIAGSVNNDKLDLTCPQCGHYARTRAKIGDNATCPICKAKFTIEASQFEEQDAMSINQDSKEFPSVPELLKMECNEESKAVKQTVKETETLTQHFEEKEQIAAEQFKTIKNTNNQEVTCNFMDSRHTTRTDKEMTKWFVLTLLAVVLVAILAERFSNTPAATRANFGEADNVAGEIDINLLELGMRSWLNEHAQGKYLDCKCSCVFLIRESANKYVGYAKFDNGIQINVEAITDVDNVLFRVTE